MSRKVELLVIGVKVSEFKLFSSMLRVSSLTRHIEKMYDHTVTDETSVKGKQSNVRDVHNTEEAVDNQPRVILNKLNRTDMDDTVINITGQQNTDFSLRTHIVRIRL
jgi:hypothetical protein